MLAVQLATQTAAAVPVDAMSTPFSNQCPRCKKHVGPDGHCSCPVN